MRFKYWLLSIIILFVLMTILIVVIFKFDPNKIKRSIVMSGNDTRNTTTIYLRLLDTDTLDLIEGANYIIMKYNMSFNKTLNKTVSTGIFMAQQGYTPKKVIEYIDYLYENDTIGIWAGSDKYYANYTECMVNTINTNCDLKLIKKGMVSIDLTQNVFVDNLPIFKLTITVKNGSLNDPLLCFTYPDYIRIYMYGLKQELITPATHIGWKVDKCYYLDTITNSQISYDIYHSRDTNQSAVIKYYIIDKDLLLENVSSYDSDDVKDIIGEFNI